MATVTEACEVVWCNEEVATMQVREALDSFVQELVADCAMDKLCFDMVQTNAEIQRMMWLV